MTDTTRTDLTALAEELERLHAAAIHIAKSTRAPLRSVPEWEGHNRALRDNRKTIIAALRAVGPVREALESCDEYFDGMADAEYFTDRASPVPNEEMRLLTKVRTALSLLDKIGDGT